MQMVVVRNLAHVIIKIPAARILGIGNPSQGVLHDGAFRIVRRSAVLAKDSHGHIARIAV